MKTFKKIALALLAVVLCVHLVSCGDDDDEVVANSLLGTWSYVSNDGSEGEFTFKSDGTLLWNDGEEITSNHTYSLQGEVLKIVFNDNDDYTEGTLKLSGNTATYRYYWADCAGKWKDDEMSTMTLIRK